MVRLSTLMTVALAALATCGYGPTFTDCAIACASPSDCPNGLQCGAEGRCRLPGAVSTCAAILGDAGVQLTDGKRSGSDGMTTPDAADPATLVEYSDSTASEPAPGCDPSDCGMAVFPGSGSPVDIHWYREFALRDSPNWDFGASGFEITGIQFACDESSNPDVTVNVYSYPVSMLYQATIDLAAMTPMLASAGPVTITSCPGEVEVPLSAQVLAGSAFVVEIFETDFVNGNNNNDLCSINGEFRLGANTGSEIHPSYFYEPDPDACQLGSAASTPTSLNGSAALVISVTGTPMN
jgi:hypothetical protein